MTRPVTASNGTDFPRGFDLEPVAELASRSAQSWHVRCSGADLVLRRYVDPLDLGHSQLGRSIAWQSSVRALAAEAGWPTARPYRAPIEHAGSWWTLEEYLPGASRSTTPSERAELITCWHATLFATDELGPQPGARDHLRVLADEDVPALLRRCTEPTDREWLLRRFDQARDMLEGIDLSASRRTLVHGDLTNWNLLWDGKRLTGLLDLELATVGRRVTELTLSWRCRYDDLVHALHRLDPLSPGEWRMLLVDWWALLLDLAALQLRQGLQPDRWELDGLRRRSALADLLEVGDLPE